MNDLTPHIKPAQSHYIFKGQRERKMGGGVDNFLNGVMAGLAIAIAILLTVAMRGSEGRPTLPPVVPAQEPEPVQQEATQEATRCDLCINDGWPILRPKVTRMPAIRNVERW